MIRVELPYATFGLLVRGCGSGAVVVEAAPIASWATGRPARAVWDYYVRKGAQVTWHGA